MNNRSVGVVISSWRRTLKGEVVGKAVFWVGRSVVKTNKPHPERTSVEGDFLFPNLDPG